ncbi:hypothetical protein LSCM1_06156 [Leishmania martiniquensis]|uniref:DNA polymerase theta (Helicase domain only) n=1 Tax=Leishmania martiniquensis TaxID=1580590 RepID=A0A836GB82_9TRYP|nr:hypothetical protein LSCM1_06156 [Leishmania martiniquensis]
MGGPARIEKPREVPTDFFPLLAAAEEAERGECDEALEREMDEDLRMSTDIAFTPSGTGSGAPPFFSQSSMMEEDGKPTEGDSGEEEACSRGSGLALERPGNDRRLRCSARVSGEEGHACICFRSQGGAGGGALTGSSPPPSIAISGTPGHRALLSCGSHHDSPTTTECAHLFPQRSTVESAGAFARIPSALPTWLTREATPPRLQPALAPGAGLLPLAAAGGGGGFGVGGAGSGRHRTIFSFRSLRADTETAAPPPDAFDDAKSCPLDSSVVTVTDEAFASTRGEASPAAGSGSTIALPARPGRTCFTLHSAVPMPVTASYSATTVVEPTSLATGAAPQDRSGTGYPPGEESSSGSCCAELQQLPGRCTLSPQRAPLLSTFADGAVNAAPSSATRAPSYMESSHATMCAQEPIVNAQPRLLLPISSAPATVITHCSPLAPTSEESPQRRRSLPLQQAPQMPVTAATTEQGQLETPSKESHSPALFTAAAASPLVNHTRAEASSVTASLPASVPVVRDEAAHLHPGERREMLFPLLSAPPPPSSPLLLSPAAADDTAGLFYDLPCEVGHFYATRRGITSLYDWQHNLLTHPEVRQGGNFVYSLPTSGGKTLVAELSLLRCVLNRRKSCFLVLPFVSLAEEKTMALQPLTTALDFNVEGHYGSSGRFPLSEAPAVYVCTIEKANSLLNHILEEGRADEIGAVVVDELHMVGEPRRGATLELFLSKMLLISAARHRQHESVDASVSQRCDSVSGAPSGQLEELEGMRDGVPARTAVTGAATVAIGPDPLQIIGMSATVPNLRTIAAWLRAACFEYDFRPVPLRSYSVVGGLVLRDGEHNERNLSSGSVTQHLIELATEVPDASVVIFCASRQQCVDTARGIVSYLRAQAIAGETMPPTIDAGGSNVPVDSPSISVLGVPFPSLTKGPATAAAVAAVPSQASLAIKGILADLEALAHAEASQLSELMPFGVAFHHGGLLAEERDLIETAFRRKHIRILCCTSTLAAGVNLPARRVIIKAPYVGREFLTRSRYLQMCGRAGRAGLDPYGESYLLLSSRDETRGHALMRAPMEPCCSQLLEDDETLTRSLLECVGVGLVTDFQSASRWSDSLLSRWAVGPVEAMWQPHIAAVTAPVASASATSAPSPAAENAACGTATSFSLASRVAHDGSADAAQDVESSRSALGPTASPPSRPASLTSPSWPCMPLAVINAMVRTSLAKLARCGLIRVADTRTDASGTDGVTTVSGNNDISLTNPIHTRSGGGAAATDGTGFDAASSAALEALLSRAFNESGNVDASVEARDACHMQLLVTPFGSSSVRSCFSVAEALLLRDELDELQHTGLILSDDLHLCYFLTPLREVGRCDWALLRLLMSRMSDSRQRIASLLGVDAYFVDQQAMGLGGPLEASAEGRRRLFTAKRFYVALMLADVLAEVPMATVEQRYNVSRGQLQSLMRSASMFSSSITSFCHAMEWFSLEAVLASFVKRLGFGVKPDLLPLMEIRGMQPPRARALWNAGFKRIAAIAVADADDMLAKVKAMNPKDAKAAKFFTKRAALMAIREANLALQSQIKEKKDELHELTARRGRGFRGLR